MSRVDYGARRDLPVYFRGANKLELYTQAGWYLVQPLRVSIVSLRSGNSSNYTHRRCPICMDITRPLNPVYMTMCSRRASHFIVLQ